MPNKLRIEDGGGGGGCSIPSTVAESPAATTNSGSFVGKEAGGE